MKRVSQKVGTSFDLLISWKNSTVMKQSTTPTTAPRILNILLYLKFPAIVASLLSSSSSYLDEKCIQPSIIPIKKTGNLA